MPNKKTPSVGVKLIKAAIGKAIMRQGIENTSLSTDIWVTPPFSLQNLATIKDQSAIMPQCITAYKNNIAGFGVDFRYKTDEEVTPEMEAEKQRAQEIFKSLSFESDIKTVFENIIEARETYGIAYVEVVRNIAGEVIALDFIKDTPSITKTNPLVPYIEIERVVNGQTEKRPRKFCKYRQQIGASTVYFKEIGDPRIMEASTGEYVESLEIDKQANEILEFAIGSDVYGKVRWLGQVLGLDGSRKAEELNYRYFLRGRHTPLMLMVNGGTLTEESFTKLQHYMSDIEGANGQHGFIVLEAENVDGRTVIEGDTKPSVDVVKLGDILQRDELFQEYLNNNRRRVQSAFQLPDLYVGYTMDFNRATSQTAQEITEEQVFQPERLNLAWVINNKLLVDYDFKYVEAYVKGPTISNPDDFVRILGLAEKAGGLTPNKAKEIALSAFGEKSDGFEGDWGDIPLAVRKLSPQVQESMGFEVQAETGIEKACQPNENDIVPVLREIRGYLSEKAFTETEKSDIIKADEGRWITVNGARIQVGEDGRLVGNVGDKITAGSKFSTATNQQFAADIANAKASLKPEEAWRVDAKSEAEYAGVKTFVSDGGSCVAVKPDGDIISVCKSAGDNMRGSELLMQAVANGGDRLDAFGEKLYNFYTRNGFEPISWTPFNPEFAPTGWNSDRDKQEPIVFYKYTGSRTSRSFNDFISHTAPHTGESGYDNAFNARNRSI